MTVANPATWLCPVCCRIPVAWGKSCPQRTAEAWDCDHLDNPVNATLATTYRRQWAEGRQEGKSIGIAEIMEGDKG